MVDQLKHCVNKEFLMNKAYAYTAGGLVLAMLGGLAFFVFMNATEEQFASCSGSTVAGGAAIGG